VNRRAYEPLARAGCGVRRADPGSDGRGCGPALRLESFSGPMQPELVLEVPALVVFVRAGAVISCEGGLEGDFRQGVNRRRVHIDLGHNRRNGRPALIAVREVVGLQ
jgi:hypothetical protein